MPAMSDFKEEKHQSESRPGRSRDKSLPVRDLSVAEDREDPPRRILFPSESLATDGGLIAITDVSEAMTETGLESDYRVVGGIAVMLHVLRTGANIPIRSTGDADYGVPPRVLTEGKLVREIERQGYAKTEGNRWERQIDDERTATVDLLIPAYTSRARSSRQVGEVNTTEVPGLAEAFLAEPCIVDAEFILTNGEHLSARVLLPDSKSMILLKAGARRIRNEDRDATDLWRCLEVANADGVTAADFTTSDVAQIRDLLQRELGRGGNALGIITRDLSPGAAGQTATRIQALLGRIVGF
jgi:hypothetical protein